jgi:hypothetical protein
MKIHPTIQIFHVPRVMLIISSSFLKKIVIQKATSVTKVDFA